MTLPRLVDMHGRPFRVDRLIGKGGEGDVFTIPNDAANVAKIYNDKHKPDSEKAEKLTALIMMANPQRLSVAAWPTSLLFDATTRRVDGFVMPRLVGYQDIWQLYNPAERLKAFPRAGWTFQVHAATHLAFAFQEIHKSGCLVADVNMKNVQVDNDAKVRLIDCDSFQVNQNGKSYLCSVGVEHYTPPELQGKHFRNVVRTENHDRFGLAVLIFQLLFVGRHPYQGVYRGVGDPGFVQLISEFRFAWGPMAQSWDMSPPPLTPTFEDIPPEVGSLFRRAFERGSELGTRPRAEEWLKELVRLQSASGDCTADPGHKYWKGAKGCVWCRLAANRGLEYYFGVTPGIGTFSVDEAKLQELVRRLSAAQPTEFRYERSRFAPLNRPKPNPIPEAIKKFTYPEEDNDDSNEDLLDSERKSHYTISLVLAIAIFFGLVLAIFGLVKKFIAIIGMITMFVFSIWLIIHLLMSPYAQSVRRANIQRRLIRDSRRRAEKEYNRQVADEVNRRERRLSSVESQLIHLEQQWKDKVNQYLLRHRELSASSSQLVAECRNLTPQFQLELQRLAVNAEATARMRHLRFHLLTDAEIPNIGAGRKRTLAAAYVETAAEIDRDTIQKIPGFGPVLTANLLRWKEEVLQTFRFDPKAAISASEQAATIAQFRAKEHKMLADINRNLIEIESLTLSCRNSLQLLVSDLQAAILLLEQARIDLKLVQDKFH